jgi:type-F conjugative transfer system pilin assembly protein TrbC
MGVRPFSGNQEKNIQLKGRILVMSFGVSATVARFKYIVALSLIASTCYAGEVYVFLSASMPRDSKIKWLTQAKQADATAVARGFDTGNLNQVITEANYTGKNGEKLSLMIDPDIFKKYQIEKVPAVVFSESDDNFFTVYGDIGLLSAAKQANAVRESPTAQKAIKKLTSAYYKSNDDEDEDDDDY